MVIEELLKLFVGEVDAQLLETVELLETKEGGEGKQTENKGKKKKKRQLSLMLLTQTTTKKNIGDFLFFSFFSLSFLTNFFFFSFTG